MPFVFAQERDSGRLDSLRRAEGPRTVAACAINRGLHRHELTMEWMPLPCERAHPLGTRAVEHLRDRVASLVQLLCRFQGVGDPPHVGVGLGIRQHDQRHTRAPSCFLNHDAHSFLEDTVE